MNSEQIIAATVRIEKLGGQGVLIPGGMILTAAHCINWSGDGSMALGEWFIEGVRTADGRSFRARPIFVDPVADIAVLGCLPIEEPAFQQDLAAFDEFCESCQGIPVSAIRPPMFEKFRVSVYSHEARILAGVGMFCNEDRCMVELKMAEQIKGGTSGGPVVDGTGSLLGVVSTSSGNIAASSPPRPCTASVAFAHRSLPVWIVELTTIASDGDKSA